MKLFKIVQLVPLRAGRIFESIGHTLIADRVVVILLFIFVLMVIFTLSFYMMYSSNNSGYSTVYQLVVVHAVIVHIAVHFLQKDHSKIR